MVKRSDRDVMGKRLIGASLETSNIDRSIAQKRGFARKSFTRARLHDRE